MQATPAVTEEEALVAELELLGIRYLSRQTTYHALQVRPPAQLLADMMRQPSVRVRESVIAVLLAHPRYVDAIPQALCRLGESESLTLRLFYTAAVLLQREYAEQLKTTIHEEWRTLPDLFSPEFGVPPATFRYTNRLASLAQTHSMLTGIKANWAGTYENVVRKLIHRWDMEKQWSQRK
jgi:hypothetical protein